MADPYQERLSRLQRLQQAVDRYVEKEQSRIDQEVQVLTNIKDGRKAGASGAGAAIEKAAIAAQVDLSWFLKGT